MYLGLNGGWKSFSDNSDNPTWSQKILDNRVANREKREGEQLCNHVDMICHQSCYNVSEFESFDWKREL